MEFGKGRKEGVIVLSLCFLLILSQRPAFCETGQNISPSSASLPSKLASFVCHTVTTVNGSVNYINEKYQRMVGSNLYLVTQLIYGYGEMYGLREGEPYRKSKDSIVGLGIGFRRYINSSNLWYEGSASAAYISTTLETSSEPKSTTELSGLLIANIGYTWFFEEKLAMDILIGVSWPSLYLKSGMPDDLYASSFFGLGLSFVL